MVDILHLLGADSDVRGVAEEPEVGYTGQCTTGLGMDQWSASKGGIGVQLKNARGFKQRPRPTVHWGFVETEGRTGGNDDSDAFMVEPNGTKRCLRSPEIASSKLPVFPILSFDDLSVFRTRARIAARYFLKSACGSCPCFSVIRSRTTATTCRTHA